MSDPRGRSFWLRFWANGGVFSIIALCFFLLSFIYSIFLAPGLVFVAISLAWYLRDKKSKPKPPEDQGLPPQS